MSLTLKDIHVLIFTTYKYATLSDKSDYADVITNLQRRRLAWVIQVGPMESQGPSKECCQFKEGDGW